MSTASNIHREFAECWNRRDFDTVRTLLHREYTFTGGDGRELAGGPDVGIRLGRMWAEAFPDAKLEIRRVHTSGTTAIAEMVARGTHNGELMGIPATGRPIDLVICNVMELRDGKIYREREYLDMLTLMTQIGAISAPGKGAGA
jgi:steroid delta-isomerase-like uncharacterized protein